MVGNDQWLYFAKKIALAWRWVCYFGRDSMIIRFRARFFPLLPIEGGCRQQILQRLFPRRGERSVILLHYNYYHFFYLAKALRARGWRALSVAVIPSNEWERPFLDGVDVTIGSPDSDGFVRNVRQFVQEIKLRYGIVHFSGMGLMRIDPNYQDNSIDQLLPPVEFQYLRRHGVKIGYSAVGCNDGISQSEWSRWSEGMCQHCKFRSEPMVCSDRRNNSWAKKIRDNVDLIAAELLPPIDIYGGDKVVHLPMAFGVEKNVWSPELKIPEEFIRKKDGEILVLHAFGNMDSRTSSGADPKGSLIVFDVIERLRREGYAVRLEFVHNLPITRMKYIQVQADIVIDQLRFGRWGAMARESMMLGRPVVSWLKVEWDQESPETRALFDECPVVSANTETLYDVLKDLIENPEKREDIGRRSRAFAEKWFSTEVLAQRFEEKYDELRSREI